jgi:Deoxyribonuclease II
MRIFLKVAFLVALIFGSLPPFAAGADDAPMPLLKQGQPVEWWFVFKLNSTFPGCDGGSHRVCRFGGSVQNYPSYGQQFVYASSADHTLQKGSGCAGTSVNDPLGATFDEVYNGDYHYLIWNDQFYDDPKVGGCGESCSAPWGHSKGMLAWNDDGDGLVLQVTTPSWPAAGSKKSPRQQDGNTLGCVEDDNVLVSQHFFSAHLTEKDVVKVLSALSTASVVTDPAQEQIVSNGGPKAISDLVTKLGKKSATLQFYDETLSNGVRLIAKPSKLNVPPWQFVSGVLGGESLRAATWWATPYIFTTTAETQLTCWPENLNKDGRIARPGDVEIATTGQWQGTIFGLKGTATPNGNHAKIGVSTSGSHPYAIFGDMNQQGTAIGDRSCSSSQNGRGGLFYVLEDKELQQSISELIAGETAPLDPSDGGN